MWRFLKLTIGWCTCLTFYTKEKHFIYVLAPVIGKPPWLRPASVAGAAVSRQYQPRSAKFSAKFLSKTLQRPGKKNCSTPHRQWALKVKSKWIVRKHLLTKIFCHCVCKVWPQNKTLSETYRIMVRYITTKKQLKNTEDFYKEKLGGFRVRWWEKNKISNMSSRANFLFFFEHHDFSRCKTFLSRRFFDFQPHSVFWTLWRSQHHQKTIKNASVPHFLY